MATDEKDTVREAQSSVDPTNDLQQPDTDTAATTTPADSDPAGGAPRPPEGPRTDGYHQG